LKAWSKLGAEYQDDGMACTLGIDAGSGFTKAVIWEQGKILAYSILPSGGNYSQTARKAAEMALQQKGISFDHISSTMATGWGAAAVDFADKTASDISCHAAGVFSFFPSARTVIDIGSQFTRGIKLDQKGKAIHFVQNEKCAAGSGKFLQVIARILHIGLEEIGELSLKSASPVEFTTGCAVFAESEAVSRISQGASPADILAGVHKAMAAKIANLMIRLGIAEDCIVTGGGGKDKGLINALQAELGIKVLVPKEPQISAALGAALLAG